VISGSRVVPFSSEPDAVRQLPRDVFGLAPVRVAHARPVSEEAWVGLTAIAPPGPGELGIHEPGNPVAPWGGD
jgi:hypothetical protein